MIYVLIMVAAFGNHRAAPVVIQQEFTNRIACEDAGRAVTKMLEKEVKLVFTCVHKGYNI